MKKLLTLLLITALLCGCAEQSAQVTTTTASTTTTTATTTSETTTTTTAPATTTTPETSAEPEETDIYANPTDTAMPEREHECENNDYYQPCINRFDLPSGFFDIIDNESMKEWNDKMVGGKTPYDIENYANTYSFMVYFDLSFEEIYPAIEEHNKFYQDLVDKGSLGVKEAIFTDEDLEVLKSGDKATITKHFARKYSIVIGDKIYNPNWIYNHTIEDYEAQGITKEMISEKIEIYRTLAFSDECRAALETKLETYIGEDIEFSYVSPFTE